MKKKKIVLLILMTLIIILSIVGANYYMYINDAITIYSDDDTNEINVNDTLTEELYKKVDMLNVVNISSDSFILPHLYEDKHFDINYTSRYDRLLVALYNTNSICAKTIPTNSVVELKESLISHMERAKEENVVCNRELKVDDVINTYNSLFGDVIDENNMIESLNNEFYYDSNNKIYYQTINQPYGKMNYFGYNYKITCGDNSCDVYRAVGYSSGDWNGTMQSIMDNMGEMGYGYNEINSENYDSFIKFKYTFVKQDDVFVIKEINYYEFKNNIIDRNDEIDYGEIYEGEKINLDEQDKKKIISDLETVENSFLWKNGDNITSYKFSLAILNNKFSSLKYDDGATGSVSVGYDEFKEVYKKMFDEDFHLSEISGVTLRHNNLHFGEYTGKLGDYEFKCEIKGAYYNENASVYTVNVNNDIKIKFTKENNKIKYKYIKNWDKES